MHTSRHIKHLPKALRWIALACVLGLVSAQTFALEHIHLDPASESACVVCGHSDTSANVEISGFVSPIGPYTEFAVELLASQTHRTVTKLHTPRAAPTAPTYA